MRVTVCAVGRLGRGPERDLIDRFSQRIRWPLVLREVEERRKLSPELRRRREGDLLDKACPAGAVRIVLDERGDMLTSPDFAKRIGFWRDSGREIAFVIGGPNGLTQPMRASADLILGFGAATWPHKLVRVMVIEQLYRAQEILSGNPYPRN